MDELPNLRLFGKVAVFLLWPFALALTLFASFFLLLALPSRVNRLTLSFNPNHTYYLFQTQPDSGQVLGQSIGVKDARIEVLRRYLQEYRSPLSDYADDLVHTSDKYALPWTLLPAIAGKESGFGKVIPYGSYNAWGWGVYTGKNSGANFSSWDQAIETVAAGIRNDYFSKGLDSVEKMESVYTPSSLLRGRTWRDGVNYFIWEIQNYSRR